MIRIYQDGRIRAPLTTPYELACTRGEAVALRDILSRAIDAGHTFGEIPVPQPDSEAETVKLISETLFLNGDYGRLAESKVAPVLKKQAEAVLAALKVSGIL